jgi:hypothetical protein
LLAIGSAMLRSPRRQRHSATPLSWPALVDESLSGADVQLRLDMIERLRIVDNEWSRSVLERARQEDPDEEVRSAIDRPSIPQVDTA